MQKVFIKNRKGQKLAVLIEEKAKAKGLVFIIHGLGGNKEQPHISTVADTFRQKGFTVIRFDTTNTIGESDGMYEKATITNYHEDLQDLIQWSSKQSWYTEPFYLAGHSLGGVAALLYAVAHPEKIKGLLPLSTVISGKLSIKTNKYRDSLDDWKKSGWFTRVSSNGKDIRRLPWSHMEDRLKYNILQDAHKLVMPVFMLVGDKDDATPVEHQKMLYTKLPGKKELHIIVDAPHTFSSQSHLDSLKLHLNRWLEK